VHTLSAPDAGRAPRRASATRAVAPPGTVPPLTVGVPRDVDNSGPRSP